MLKSLGQWTSSFKQRKIIPSQSTVPPKQPSLDKEQEESSTQKETKYVTIIIKKCLIFTTIFDYKYVIFISLMCYSSHAEIKSSQEQSLNVHATDDAHDVPPTTDDNEKLMITQGEVNPQNESFPKTMDIT